MSQIVEDHVEEVEESNRVEELLSYIPLDDSIDDNDATLVPSYNDTLEDTLTEATRKTDADDSGIHNESIDEKQEKADNAKEIEADTGKGNISLEEEIFEDCVDETEMTNEKFTLEMKLALELNKNK